MAIAAFQIRTLFPARQPTRAKKKVKVSEYSITSLARGRPAILGMDQSILNAMSRLGDPFLCFILCLSAACGRTRDNDAGLSAKAGASGDTPDATTSDTPDTAVPGQRWLALINEHVELVRFDDDSPPTATTLADSGREATATFAGDGKRLAFAVKTEQGAWEVQLASAPDGEMLKAAWHVPGTTRPALVWGGDEALIASRTADASYLLLVEGGLVLNIGVGVRVRSAADHSALLALSDSRILYVGARAPQWSEAIPGTWLAQMSADGRGLAVFSQSEIPAFDFPIATTRVRWSLPPVPACAGTTPTPCPAATARYEPGYVDWPTSDSRLVVEFDDSSGDATLMDLAFVNPGETATLSAPKASFQVFRRNWGVQSDGSLFIAENPADPTTESWWLRSVHANGKLSRVQGPIGSAQYAVSSGDDGTLFVVSYTKATTKTTVYAIASPASDDAQPNALFSTNQQVNALWPQPKGPSILLETGDPTEAIYFVPNVNSPAQSLPQGLHDVQWTPDGRGFVGVLGESVVYFSAGAPEQPTTLGRGSYVLPSHW